jgi:DNA-binding response OmpR family regulator
MAHILIIDDDENIRDLLSLILSMNGHKVVTAKDGDEGLALFRRPSAKFDLVITDILMPSKDGIDTILELIALNKSQIHVPIIAMSGGRGSRLTSDFNLGTAKAIAKIQVLKKPFSDDELLNAVTISLSSIK